MALPFNPPNPYGSYFNFGSSYGGDPTPSLWRQPNYPNLGTPTSQGVAAAMGSPSGGNNPTESEFINTRRRDIAFQQFIDRAIKDDPRTRTMGNMLLDGIYGNDSRAKATAMARIGGADAYNGMIGTIMNTPGLSGYFGGSARSLAVGSLAVGTSGLTMNGYGVFGDKSMNLRFADELMRQVNGRFYSASGNPILSMTNGLNRDQMGGVMVQAASQGAFSGMDMGSFQKLDAAGKNVRFMANGDTVTKITEFMKNVTKSLGSLIDVYGNISSGELMQKAQQITGLDLSRLENAGTINDRLTRLRTTARVTGIDVQSAMDMSARAIDYGSAIGLRPEMAGTIGGYAANQGMRDFRARQMNVHGFYTNTVSPMEIIMSQARDQAAMSQDPLGSRFGALEMLIKNSGVGATEAAGLRAQAAGFSANAAGVSGLDSLIQSRFGVSAAGLIRGMGGPAAMQQQLDASQQENIVGMSYRNFNTRASGRIRSNLFRGGLMTAGSSVSQISAMHQLVTTFDNDTIEKILGGSGDLASIINPILGTDTGSIINSAKTIRSMGANGILSYHNVRSSIQADELTRSFVTREGRARNAWMDAPDISDDFRGQLLGGGFMAGMLDKYAGNDPQSKLMWLYGLRPGSVAGVGKGETIRADFGSMMYSSGPLAGQIKMDEWRKAALGWRTGLEKTAEGRALRDKLGLQGDMSQMSDASLTSAFNNLRDPDWRLNNMSNFDFFSINNGNAVAFALKSDMGLKEKYGGDIGNLKAMADDLRKKGNYAEANLLMQYAAGLATGGNIFSVDKKGVMGKTSIGNMSAGALASARALEVKTAMNQILTGGDFDAATWKQFNSTDLTGTLLRNIGVEEDSLRQGVGPSSKPARDAKIENLERAKSKLQGSAKSQMNDATVGSSNISGTLEIIDNNGILSAAVKAKLKQLTNN